MSSLNKKLTNLEQPNHMLKKQIKCLKRDKKAAYTTITILKCIIAILVLTIISIVWIGYQKIDSLNKEIAILNESNESISKDYETVMSDTKDISKMIDAESDLLVKTSKIVMDLDEELANLKEDNLLLQEENNELVSQISKYEQRKELFDKHENAILSSTRTRTDITYDDIKMLDNLANDLHMTDDSINLILALAMAESDGNQNAVNPKSSATGLGQFLSGTGRFVYTKLMKGNGYIHSTTAKDHTTNLKMMAYYIDYLDKQHHGNLTGVLDEYCGTHDQKYLAKVDHMLQKYNNITLASVKIHK